MTSEWEFRTGYCYRCEADEVPIIFWYANDPWYFTSLCADCLRELMNELSEFKENIEEDRTSGE